MKRYKIGDNYYWYNEGDQPAGAIEDNAVKTVKKSEQPSIEVKIQVPKNKSKGVKAK